MSPNFEGVYTVSAFEEGEAVEGRIAAGVEDEPAPWKFCREPPVQRRHVDPGGVRDIPRGMPAIITNNVSVIRCGVPDTKYRGGDGSGDEPVSGRSGAADERLACNEWGDGTVPRCGLNERSCGNLRLRLRVPYSGMAGWSVRSHGPRGLASQEASAFLPAGRWLKPLQRRSAEAAIDLAVLAAPLLVPLLQLVDGDAGGLHVCR